MDQQKDSGPEDNEVHLMDYLIIFAKHSRVIIYTSLAVIVVAYLYNFCAYNKYKSIARLLTPQQNLTLSGQLLEVLGGGITPGKGGSPGIGGAAASLLGMRNPGDLYVAILMGDTISNRMIERFELQKLHKKPSLEDTRIALKSNVVIETNRNSGLISIAVTDKDPKRAAAMANAYPEELDKLLRQVAVQEATGRLAFLEKERTLADANLTKAEEALRSFSEQKSVIQIDTQTKAALKYIAELKATIDAKEVQIQVLRTHATPMNYDLILLETELKGLKEKLKAAERLKVDQDCLTDICLPSSKTPSLALQYLRLYREEKFQESLYQLFTKMVELARIDTVKEVIVVQIIDRALIPEKRANKRLLPAFWTGVGTFFIMVFIIFGMEFYRKNGGSDPKSKRLALLVSYLSQWYKKPF